MNKSLTRILAASLMSMTGAACNQSGDSGQAGGADNGNNVYLKSAQLEQMAPHMSYCQGGQLDRCVEICHRPPGNPENQKTRILPLTAVRAHLEHGHSHGERDYLGRCDGEGPEDHDSNSDDSPENCSGDNDSASDDSDSLNKASGDDGSSDDDGTCEGSAGGGGASEIPAWCQPFIHIDTNCDGYIDQTGELLL